MKRIGSIFVLFSILLGPVFATNIKVNSGVLAASFQSDVNKSASHSGNYPLLVLSSEIEDNIEDSREIVFYHTNQAIVQFNKIDTQSKNYLSYAKYQNLVFSPPRLYLTNRVILI